MRRRQFIALLGGAAAMRPFAARAQQPDRMRRVGVIMSVAADDPEGKARLGAFLQGLQQSGWTDGRNVRIDIRWAAGDTERTRQYAADLVALAPDVILASGGSVAGPLLQVTRTVPIVFAQSPTRSAPDSSKAWHGQAATPPVSRCSNTASAENGWNCSETLRHAVSAWRSFAMLPYPKGSVSWLPSRPWRHRFGSR